MLDEAEVLRFVHRFVALGDEEVTDVAHEHREPSASPSPSTAIPTTALSMHGGAASMIPASQMRSVRRSRSPVTRMIQSVSYESVLAK